MKKNESGKLQHWMVMHSVGVRFHRVKIILQQKILSEHSWEFAT